MFLYDKINTKNLYASRPYRSGYMLMKEQGLVLSGASGLGLGAAVMPMGPGKARELDRIAGMRVGKK